MGDNILYPDLAAICRLCLGQCNDFVHIITGCNNSGEEISSSIPMKIMACAALEVKTNDELPKNICTACISQLEQSYYFRKRSQVSDAKLKKHIRLINMGRKSNVFNNEHDDDDYDDELGILLQKKDQAEARHLEELKNIVRGEMEAEMQEYKEKSRQELMEELKELKDETLAMMRTAVREEVKKELRDELAKEIRQDVEQECRQQEIANLLGELQLFLTEKCAAETGGKKEHKSEDKLVANKRKLSERGLEVRRKQGRYSSPRQSPSKGAECQRQNSSSNNGSENDTPYIQFLQSATNEGHGDDEVLGSFSEDGDSDPIGSSLASYVVIETHHKKEPASKDNQVQIYEDADGDDDNSDENNDEAAYHFDEASNSTKHITYTIDENSEMEFLKTGEATEVIKNVDSKGQVHILTMQDDSGETQFVEIVEFDKKSKMISESRSAKYEKALEKPLKKSSLSMESPESKIPSNVLPQRTTDTPKTFKCTSCPRSFSTEVSFNRHVRLHAKLGKKGLSYQCEICEIYLSCSSALRRHMIIHTGERPYVCEECGKSFIQREILKRHMHTHSGARPFNCPNCDRSFTQKVNLTQHIKMNHMAVPEVREHACHLCTKRFNHKSGLSRHLASHMGLAFQCTQCSRNFSDRSSVRRHIMCVHGVQNVCEIDEMMERSEVQAALDNRQKKPKQK